MHETVHVGEFKCSLMGLPTGGEDKKHYSKKYYSITYCKKK